MIVFMEDPLSETAFHIVRDGRDTNAYIGASWNGPELRICGHQTFTPEELDQIREKIIEVTPLVKQVLMGYNNSHDNS